MRDGFNFIFMKILIVLYVHLTILVLAIIFSVAGSSIIQLVFIL